MATVNFSDSQAGLFSPQEIRRLMHVEVERAQRYRYPLALMLVEVDRLDYLHDLYGAASREEVLSGVIGMLRSVTRVGDFLGCMVDQRILAVFPHTPRASASRLAGRLLRGTRTLQFESDGREIRPTLSIGLAAIDDVETKDFDALAAEAEEAVQFAVDQGGDRFVERQNVRKVIQELKADLEAETRQLEAEHAGARPAPAAAPTAHAPGPLSARLRELFRALGPLTPELERLEQEVLAQAESALAEARDQALSRAASEHERAVDVLARRVNKLKLALEGAEAELARLAQLKNVDPGLASIYRTVQGLAPGERDFERKREMLTILFEANLSLRRSLDRPAPPSAPDGRAADAGDGLTGEPTASS
jgi:diguanylate cyclase (GGDEF)-like protein